jgi:hypothetical protein
MDQTLAHRCLTLGGLALAGILLAAGLTPAPAAAQTEPVETDRSEDLAGVVEFDTATRQGTLYTTQEEEAAVLGALSAVPLGGGLYDLPSEVGPVTVDVDHISFPWPELICGNERWRVYRHSRCVELEPARQGACVYNSSTGYWEKTEDRPLKKCSWGWFNQYCVERKQVRWVVYQYDDPLCQDFLVGVHPMGARPFMCAN